MRRLDLGLPVGALTQQLQERAGSGDERQRQALALLVDYGRWDAAVAWLQLSSRSCGAQVARHMALPAGGTPLLYLASQDARAGLATLKALARGGMPRSDAEVAQLTRVFAEWEHEFTPQTPSTLQSWLNQGLSRAVACGDVACVQWWQSQGANLHFVDDDGRNAMQSAKDPDMQRWLLAQQVPLAGRRRWDGDVFNTMVRRGDYAGLREMVAQGADVQSLKWTPLHALVALQSADALAAALNGPDRAALLSQLESSESWGRTPAMLAAHQGSVEKLQLLQAAGANLQAQWGGDSLTYWLLESGKSEALQWWLEEGLGAVDEKIGGLQDAPLLVAVERDDLAQARVLLSAGADPNAYNTNSSCPMNSAQSRAMLQLLMQHGGQHALMGHEGARIWLGLPAWDARREGWLTQCTPEVFARDREMSNNVRNGQEITSDFHIALLESGESAYGAAEHFGLARSFEDEAWAMVWNGARFGQSLTGLPDGRWVQIGGEHEDGYDPDFCIYQDVIVHTPPPLSDGVAYIDDGSAAAAWDRKVYAYPPALFPPTDFHSATLVGERIVVIGGRGYPDQRRVGSTPVYALNIRDWTMAPLPSFGEVPGWLSRHQACLESPGILAVWGGQCAQADGALKATDGRWHYALDTGVWQKIS